MIKRHFILNVMLLVLISTSYAQEKVAIISMYGAWINDDSQASKYIDENQLLGKLFEERKDEVVEKLKPLFEILPGESFLDESFYKYVLDEYEPAPEDTPLTLTGLSFTGGDNIEKLKTDYRMSEYQVVPLDKYLAIGTGRPFNNDKAIKTLFENLPDSKAFLFLQFAPGLSFSGNPSGYGKYKPYVRLKVKIVNRKNKIVYKGNIDGSSASKFEVTGQKGYDDDEIYALFDESMNDLISNIGASKLAKKAPKIQY